MRNESRNYLHETTLGNVDYQRELANIFLLQVPKDLDAILAALRNSDLAAATTAAHSMKSTVGYMGFAQNIGLQLAAFEHACKNGASVSELVAELQRIQDIVERAKGVVKKMYEV